MTPQPRHSEPAWGHKITVHIYFAGEPTEARLEAITEAVGAVAVDATFMGMDLIEVAEKPYGQIAT